MPFTLRARDVMDRDVVFVEKGTPVIEAIRRMVENGVWSVVVIDKGLPVGVLTERDFIRRCLLRRSYSNPMQVPVEEIMSSPLITVGPEEPVGNVWRLMVEKKIRRVYVVEEGKIIGRVTQTGLFQKMLEAFMAMMELTL